MFAGTKFAAKINFGSQFVKGRSVKISVSTSSGRLSFNQFQPNFKRTFANEKDSLTMEVRREAGTGNKLYRLRLPLGKESVIFSPKGSETVKDFIQDLKAEDSSVSSASLHDPNGGRISASSRLDEVFDAPFELVVNGKKFTVGVGAGSNRVSSEDTESLNAAYEAMKNAGTPGTPVPSHMVPATREEILSIEKELLPLMRVKLELDRKAYRFADLALFGGLGAFSAQWMFLARLTWWDFNWDIMEPVTYFITSGTALMAYIYFVLVKQEYTFENLRDGIATKRMLTNYTRSKEFDVEKYFDLEYELKVRDPEALLRLEAYCTGHSPVPTELASFVKSEANKVNLSTA
eukprot:TRINITY_DN304_c0_g1_i1.p1 TRINITY_DN304_c0_g1~~TRINITY_DN304_c0_g1_i1.p1  ORF type:complete len:348 (-),score=139.09 TRINITY_DN304_c0_g1_i1:173-1216(-)